MITIEQLGELSNRARTKYEALFEQFPPGTVHSGRNDAYRESEEAAVCAAESLMSSRS